MSAERSRSGLRERVEPEPEEIEPLSQDDPRFLAMLARYDAAVKLARDERDVEERWALLEAALFPQDERLRAMAA